MRNSTRAIVLHKLKYRDNDLIVKCYTERDGVASYLVRGALTSKKSSNKTAYFQPLSLLEIQQSYKDGATLRNIKELKPYHLYQTLHSDIRKGAIAMFLAEVLAAILNEEEPNSALFQYLDTTFQWLDAQKDFANFHLLFLLKLTRFLGFYPDVEGAHKPFFDLMNGSFEDADHSVYSISDQNLELLKKLLGTNFEAVSEINLSSKQRQAFLGMLLLYFELHLGNFRKPKSLEVFNQIFN